MPTLMVGTTGLPHYRQPQTMSAVLTGVPILASLVLVAGCDGPQSALATAGRDADRIAQLFIVMVVGALIVWTAVVIIAVHAIRTQRETHSQRSASLLIIGGGVAVPTVVLGALLIYGLRMLPEIVAPALPGARRIDVSAKQWWWRVQYVTDGRVVETANELRLPVGQRAELHLSSSDVIHSFWVPSIAGKMDMIPGRRTRLALEPTRTGVFRGTCAEYCGASHALMNLVVVVMEPAEFEDWLQRQAEPAVTSSVASKDAPGIQGEAAFVANGCGACHTVRGTVADGTAGPDLTHVGSRLRIGAGILDNERETFLRWIAETDALKPGVHMPAFRALPPAALTSLAAYLESLR
jgi:cytochrome c oxidase subunit 2